MYFVLCNTSNQWQMVFIVKSQCHVVSFSKNLHKTQHSLQYHVRYVKIVLFSSA